MSFHQYTPGQTINPPEPQAFSCPTPPKTKSRVHGYYKALTCQKNASCTKEGPDLKRLQAGCAGCRTRARVRLRAGQLLLPGAQPQLSGHSACSCVRGCNLALLPPQSTAAVGAGLLLLRVGSFQPAVGPTTKPGSQSCLFLQLSFATPLHLAAFFEAHSLVKYFAKQHDQKGSYSPSSSSCPQTSLGYISNTAEIFNLPVSDTVAHRTLVSRLGVRKAGQR